MTVNLNSPNARAKLAPRTYPYEHRIVRGLTLGYLTATSRWVVIFADGNGGRRREDIGFADDNGVKADGTTILGFEQALDAARNAANASKGGVVNAAKTLDEVLTAYALDLKNRGKNAYNATAPRVHMAATLLAMPADKVTVAALRAWRQSLIDGGMKAATLNRLMKPLIAALNLEAQEDGRVAGNRQAWRAGLKMLAGATTARDAVLSDAEVRAIVAAAYDIDPAFGLFAQAHAELGARTSQIIGITVGDLQGDRVLVPGSHKGRGVRKAVHTPVPIAPGLAAALAAAANGREAHAPLFVKSDGTAWADRDHRAPFEKAAKAAGVEATIYALRHSSIARKLARGVPIAFVAKVHDTSVGIIEAHYGRFIVSHYDDVLRATLIDTTPGANVVQGAFPQTA
jgi:integrase